MRLLRVVLAVLALVLPLGRGANAVTALASSNGRIAYLCTRSADRLCVMDADGKNIAVLPAARSPAAAPIWSTNGGRLLVESAHGATLIAGNGRLVRTFPRGTQFTVSWRTGEISFATSRGIMLGALRGSRPRTVVRGEVFDPALSPDGSKIVWADSSGYLDLLDVASASKRQVLRDPSRIAEAPTWSPDSKWIAYYANPTDPVLELWVMRSDGSGKRRLVSNGGQFDPNSSYDWPIVWSPNGKELAYTGEDHGQVEVYVVDVSSGHRRQLASSFSDAATPSWSPDGKTIAFVSNHDHTNLRMGALEIYRVSADDKRLRRLTFNQTDDSVPVWRP